MYEDERERSMILMTLRAICIASSSRSLLPSLSTLLASLFQNRRIDDRLPSLLSNIARVRWGIKEDGSVCGRCGLRGGLYSSATSYCVTQEIRTSARIDAGEGRRETRRDEQDCPNAAAASAQVGREDVASTLFSCSSCCFDLMRHVEDCSSRGSTRPNSNVTRRKSSLHWFLIKVQPGARCRIENHPHSKLLALPRVLLVSQHWPGAIVGSDRSKFPTLIPVEGEGVRKAEFVHMQQPLRSPREGCILPAVH